MQKRRGKEIKELTLRTEIDLTTRFAREHRGTEEYKKRRDLTQRHKDAKAREEKKKASWAFWIGSPPPDFGGGAGGGGFLRASDKVNDA